MSARSGARTRRWQANRKTIPCLLRGGVTHGRAKVTYRAVRGIQHTAPSSRPAPIRWERVPGGRVRVTLSLSVRPRVKWDFAVLARCGET